MAKEERYSHHQRRLMQFVAEINRLNSLLYHRGNGYYREPGDPLRQALEPRLHRLYRLMHRAERSRDRYAVRSMPAIYRAWP